VEGRRIGRTSDRPQVLGGNTGPVRRSCQDCKSTLYILPQDQKNYMCLECGQKYPIEQQQPKGKLSTIDESNSNSIGVVQPQNSQSRKPRPLRERSPLEEELTAKGYSVIDSQWITPRY
jgi:DNA-directed RNA polymerase subunit M/transcription elongation factor TFIIS